jgi:vanillate O-demethylase ferredoxin subunit
MIRGLRLPQHHRDLFPTDEEHAANDCMTVCCSRSRSALRVLDLTPY